MKEEKQTQQIKSQNSTQIKSGQIQEKRKKRNQQIQKQAQENRKKWMPFIKYLKKQGLKFKNARCKKFRIEYFRVEEAERIIEENREKIEKNESLKDLYKSWQKEVIYFIRPQNLPKLKYPQELQRSEGNNKAKFASFKFDTAEPKTWLFPLILFGVIAVVLFPFWPWALKYTVFYVCLYLLIALISLIVLRLIVYIFCAIFGLSFWIMPNFFADVSIVQSFLPFYSITKWETDIFSIIGRCVAFLIVSYYGYHLYIDPSWLFENIEITKQSVDDLHDWGVSKLKGEKSFSQSALTNLQDIMNRTADVHIDETMDLGEGNEGSVIDENEKHENAEQQKANQYENQEQEYNEKREQKIVAQNEQQGIKTEM